MSNYLPRNAVTGAVYQGKNIAILLAAGAAMDGGTDPRWCTFLQAKEAGWKVKKGSKAPAAITKFVKVRDVDEKDGERKFKSVPKSYAVFHASQIEGIPPWDGGD